MPISLDMRRTEFCFFLALCKLCGPPEIFSDNRGVVQALNEGEVDRISAGHNDPDLWMWVWNKVGACIEEGFDIRVVWTEGTFPA